MRRLVAAGTLMFAAQALFAAPDERAVAACASMTIPTLRESCFNVLATSGESPAKVFIFGKPNTPPPTPGKWQSSVGVNPVDDSIDIRLRLVADSGVSPFGNPVVLTARCTSGEVDAYIDWDEYLGLDYTTVTYRVDANQAISTRWSLSTNFEATFSRAPIDFLTDIMTANRLIVQVTPYGENQRTVQFDPSGLDVASVELRQACGW